MDALSAWAPPTRQPWPLEGQCTAAGLEAPTVTNGDGFHFLAARLFVHVCRVAACLHCAEWRKLTGVRTVRVTKDEIANGIALDRIGGLTYRKVEGGLF